MKKRNSNHRVVFNLVVIIVLAIAIMCSVGFVVSAKSDKSSSDINSYYQSIRVESGDTLWSIATEYCPDTQEISDYIDEIKSINSIKNDTIKAGDYIIVSVYTY